MLAIVIQVAALVYIQGLPFMFTSTCTTLWSHTNDGPDGLVLGLLSVDMACLLILPTHAMYICICTGFT